MLSKRSKFACAMVAGVLSLGVGASSAAAQVDQEGLANVNVSGVTIQVPIGVAANLCDVTVNALTGPTIDSPAECDATTQSIATSGQNGRERVEQDGLVNVNVSNVLVQLPISVAANICDLNVNVLAAQLDIGETACTATAESTATRGRGGNGGG